VTSWRRALLSAVWTVSVTALLVILLRLGSGDLSTPPVDDATRLRAWMAQRDAIVAAFAILRLIAVLLACYLLVCTVGGLLARTLRIPRLVRLVDLGTAPALRRLLCTAAGLGLSASTATLIVDSALVRDRPPVVNENTPAATGAAVVTRLSSGPPLVVERLPDREDDEGTVTMKVVPPPRPPAAEPQFWTAAAGDHFWHMAETTLAETWHRSPSDAEVAPYWGMIVDANRAKLVDRSNPDLLYVGQVFRLPTPPSPPAPAD